MNWDDVAGTIHKLAGELPSVDLVVGVFRGGMVPAAMLARRLERPVETFQAAYRRERGRPVDLRTVRVPAVAGLRVALVEDWTVTGTVMEYALVELVKAGALEVVTVALGAQDYEPDLFVHLGTVPSMPWGSVATA